MHKYVITIPLLLGFILLLQSCGAARDSETRIRLNFIDAFPTGATFAFAEQAYPSQRSERIPNSQRNGVIKQIKYFFTQHDILIDDDARYVINFYREYYTDDEGVLDVEVAAQMKQGRLQYAYQIQPGCLSNNRDGALVIDVFDRETQTLLRQVVSQYYFGEIQIALRQSPDGNKRKYGRGIKALSHLFGVEY